MWRRGSDGHKGVHQLLKSLHEMPCRGGAQVGKSLGKKAGGGGRIGGLGGGGQKADGRPLGCVSQWLFLAKWQGAPVHEAERSTLGVQGWRGWEFAGVAGQSGSVALARSIGRRWPGCAISESRLFFLGRWGRASLAEICSLAAAATMTSKMWPITREGAAGPSGQLRLRASNALVMPRALKRWAGKRAARKCPKLGLLCSTYFVLTE
ncbi:hypothetical protein L209DRAFT_326556 [Thermothelomyces heterothallicus CBS 203.75]